MNTTDDMSNVDDMKTQTSHYLPRDLDREKERWWYLQRRRKEQRCNADDFSTSYDIRNADDVNNGSYEQRGWHKNLSITLALPFWWPRPSETALGTLFSRHRRCLAGCRTSPREKLSRPRRHYNTKYTSCVWVCVPTMCSWMWVWTEDMTALLKVMVLYAMR